VIIAIGSLSQPAGAVAAMRAGAREFIGRPTTTADLLETFGRLKFSRSYLESIN
jgi:hypothetical protein